MPDYRKDRIWFLGSSLAVVVALAISYFAAHYYFDISDEGLQAYLVSAGRAAPNVMQYHYLAHKMGSFLWGNDLLSYRTLFYAFNGLGAAVLAASLLCFFDLFKKKTWFKFITFFNVIFAIQICSTWFMIVSYQSSAAFAVSLWVSAFFWVLSKQTRLSISFGLVLLFLSIVLGLTAKLSTGLALIAGAFVFMPLFYFIKKRRHMGLKLFFAIVGVISFSIISFLCILGESVDSVFQAYTLVGSGRDHSLALVLFRHIRDIVVSCVVFIPVFFLFWFCLFKVSSAIDNNSSARNSTLGYFFLLVIMAGLFGYTFSAFSIIPEWVYHLSVGGFPVIKIISPVASSVPAKMMMFLISLVGCCILFRVKQGVSSGQHDSVRDYIIVFCVCILGGLASGSGTSVHLIYSMRFTSGLVAASGCYYILFCLPERSLFSRVLAVSLSLFLVGGLALFYQTVYLNYYRSAPLEQQVAQSKHSSFLQGVTIEQDKADLIDSLIVNLEKFNFEKGRDKIFVTPASPGLLAASGAIGFGHLWPTGTNHELVSQMFGLAEVTPEMKVFILRGIDISPVEMSGFLSRLKIDADFRSVNLGSMRNIREGKDLIYYLEGPYIKSD